MCFRWASQEADNPLGTDLGDPAFSPHQSTSGFLEAPSCCEQPGLSLLGSLFDATVEVFPSGAFGDTPLCIIWVCLPRSAPKDHLAHKRGQNSGLWVIPRLPFSVGIPTSNTHRQIQTRILRSGVGSGYIPKAQPGGPRVAY